MSFLTWGLWQICTRFHAFGGPRRSPLGIIITLECCKPARRPTVRLDKLSNLTVGSIGVILVAKNVWLVMVQKVVSFTLLYGLFYLQLTDSSKSDKQDPTMDTVNKWWEKCGKMPKTLPISSAKILNVQVTAKCSIATNVVATTARITTMKIRVHRSFMTNSCSLNMVACVAVHRN